MRKPNQAILRERHQMPTVEELTQQQHDKTLEAVFRRLHEKGLTINKRKCLYNQSTLNFFGLVFGPEGVSPDPCKVEAIKNNTQPTNVAEVKSFLGMINYCCRFIKDYATISKPLRCLTKTDTP